MEVKQPKHKNKSKEGIEDKSSSKGGFNKFINLSLNTQVGGFYFFVMIIFMILYK